MKENTLKNFEMAGSPREEMRWHIVETMEDRNEEPLPNTHTQVRAHTHTHARAHTHSRHKGRIRK